MITFTKSFCGQGEDYRKNLACIQEVTDRLLSHMKGHGYSFRQEITDGKGSFSQEKLCSLVKELVGHWAETLRKNTDKNPDTGESLAEPYIRERRELYGLYLYLVMRCSLCEGAYAKAYPYGPVSRERTDFAFLLEQAVSPEAGASWPNRTGAKRTSSMRALISISASISIKPLRIPREPSPTAP